MFWYDEMNDVMLFGGFVDRLTDGRTDIGGCRVAFASAKLSKTPLCGVSKVDS